MLKRSRSPVRAFAVVIAVIGLSLGLIGTIGESAAQSDGPKKDDTIMKADDKAMMNQGQKSDGIKKEEMARDGMAPPKDDKMKDDKMMMPEKR
jgi:hypothetical protein